VKWKPGFLPVDLAKETWAQTRRAQLLLVASSLAYTTILSIIPMLAVSFAIFKAFGGMEKLYLTVEPFILQNLAEGSSDEVIAILNKFLTSAHTSAVGIGGFIGLVITSMSMLNSIERAFNHIWGAPARRHFFQKIATYWLFITMGPLALAVAVGFASGNDLPLSSIVPDGTGMFVLAILFFTLAFKWVPNCEVHWPHAWLAALFTSVCLNIARVAYGLYATHFVSYNKIYGSLGAVPILLLWIYVLWIIILLGAALSAALQHRLEARRPTSGGRQGVRA
jgi:membrane protein